MRRLCVWCVPNHVMDDGGPIKKEDDVSHGLCPEAAATVAEQLKDMDKEERERLLSEEQRAQEYIHRLHEQQNEDGTLEKDEFPMKVCAACILGLILLVLAAWVGSLI